MGDNTRERKQELQDLRRYLSTEHLNARDLQERTEVLNVFQKHHQCSRCGKCCTESDPIGIIGAELVAIANHLGMSVPEFRRRYISARLGRWLLINKVEGQPCPFLEGEPGKYFCSIYDARPQVCRVFPWLSHTVIMQTELPTIGITDDMCPAMHDTFRRVKEMAP